MEEENNFSESIVLYIMNGEISRESAILDFLKQRVIKVHLLDASFFQSNKDRVVSQQIKKLLPSLGYNFKSVYLASIDNVVTNHLLSQIKFRDIITFDDGTANINQNSIYYENTSFFKKYFRYNYGRKYWIEDLRKLSSKHYTIYKHFPNIVPNPIYIPLYKSWGDNSVQSTQKKGLKIKILLGSVYNDILLVKEDENLLIEQIREFIETENIDVYIPHPGYEKDLSLNCIVIKPEVIVEELIVKYLSEYERVELYGFGSSAQLNLSGIPNIHNYVLYSPKFTLAIQSCINLFEKIATKKALDSTLANI